MGEEEDIFYAHGYAQESYVSQTVNNRPLSNKENHATNPDTIIDCCLSIKFDLSYREVSASRDICIYLAHNTPPRAGPPPRIPNDIMAGQVLGYARQQSAQALSKLQIDLVVAGLHAKGQVSHRYIITRNWRSPSLAQNLRHCLPEQRHRPTPTPPRSQFP